MKVGKALRKVMIHWGLNIYQISKESGIDRGAIGRILDGKVEATTWTNVEKIAMALEKIDLVAKITFIGTLALPDNALEEFETALKSQRKQVKELGIYMVALDKLNLINRDAVNNLKQNLHRTGSQITLEELVLMETRKMSSKDVSEAEILKPSADDI